MHDRIVQDRSKIPGPQPPDREASSRTGYTFVASIAKGGMGYVELCCRRDGRFVRWAARKRLHEQLRGDQTFRTMFMDEARLAGLIRHPNVVGVSDVGEDAEGPYLIMDYVEGLSLSRVARRAARERCPVPLQVAVRICKDAAIGLHAAHEVRAEDGSLLNLVHRDVSPQNILIGFDGSVRVTDFGIAKALGNAAETTAGVLKGNMGYLSPEQLRFEEPDRRSDLFSLGVTLYELLTAERLYANNAGFEGTRRILIEPPPDVRAKRADVPPALAELLLQMLAKDPACRPATALEVAARLEHLVMELMTGEGAITVAQYMDEHFAPMREQHRGLLAERLRVATEAPTVAAPTRMDGRRRKPARRSGATWAGVAAAIGIALVTGLALRFSRNHEAALTAGRVVAVAPRAAEVVTLPRPAEASNPAATVPAPEPAPDPREPAAQAHHDRSHRARARHHANRAAQADAGGIAVPLFTKWR